MIEPVEIRRPLGDRSATATLLYGASCMETLRGLPDVSFHCIVTSPPYWGLRDYGGDRQVWGGSSSCAHEWDGSLCHECGAWRGQFGLEPTVEGYTHHLILIFRELHRVLRDDGTVWLNLGDSYMSAGGERPYVSSDDAARRRRVVDGALKEKDLVGIPWRVAFALQAEGWYLRSEIIWAKPNALPESVRDRVTRSHEHIFMLTKRPHYFYDHDAIKEPLTMRPQRRLTARSGKRHKMMRKDKKYDYEVKFDLHTQGPTNGRNKRSVWTVTPKPYKGAHFAVFPHELIDPCILAGTSEKGCCPRCGNPWVRIVENSGGRDWRDDDMVAVGIPGEGAGDGGYKRGRSRSPLNDTKTRTTTGWQPTCECPSHDPVPCKVLDPFSGSGTTGAVCLDRGRDYVGLDLNAEYIDLAVARLLGEDAPCPLEDEDGGILDFLGVQEW